MKRWGGKFEGLQLRGLVEVSRKFMEGFAGFGPKKPQNCYPSSGPGSLRLMLNIISAFQTI